MTDTSKDPVCELLAQSLLAWHVEGSVQRMIGGAILMRVASKEVCIEPSPKNLPFRWMVSVDGRRRGAISLVAVLRQVRAALDPDYAANRVRVTLARPVRS